ncbi:MAG: flagellar M-ring protein FliF, partial [Paucibacter sp.]|nr:flagellar M-ring protein FliF [Roseateles sp.]
AVSVLDSTGALISAATDTENGLDSQQLQYKQQIEANLNKRIYDLLEPVVGHDNLRANVTADVDFSQIESTAEEFKPNQGPNTTATVRSVQSNNSTNGSPALPTGVPGAASNQPPAGASAPINGTVQPLQAAQGGSGQQSSRNENLTNYEVDKTVRVVRNATGVVRHLNAAVVLNHRSTTDAKGKTSTSPVSQEELDKITALVKETVGFNQERGDSVKVITAPFMVDKPELADTPVWKQPWLLDMIRAAAVPAALVLVAMIAVFGMVRPAIRAAYPPPPPEPTAEEKAAEEARLRAVVDEENQLPGAGLPALEAPVSSDKLIRARELAKQNPQAVANIMRAWVNGDVP